MLFEFMCNATGLCFTYRHVRRLVVDSAKVLESSVRAHMTASQVVICKIIDNFQMIARPKYQRCTVSKSTVVNGVQSAAFLARGYEVCQDMPTTPGIEIWDLKGADILDKGVNSDRRVIDIKEHDEDIRRTYLNAHFDLVIQGADSQPGGQQRP